MQIPDYSFEDITIIWGNHTPEASTGLLCAYDLRDEYFPIPSPIHQTQKNQRCHLLYKHTGTGSQISSNNLCRVQVKTK